MRRFDFDTSSRLCKFCASFSPELVLAVKKAQLQGDDRRVITLYKTLPNPRKNAVVKIDAVEGSAQVGENVPTLVVVLSSGRYNRHK